MPRFTAIYRVTCDAASIEARAQAIALEQSVELPLSCIDDPDILRDVAGEVQDIAPAGPGQFDVRIGLAVETTGFEAGQLVNMLFGNTSIHDDVALIDVDLPSDFAVSFRGPNHGIGGLRRRAGAVARALTCTALKPQGLASDALARLAGRFALGGIDFVKDDHGLANQSYSPFAERVPACARAVAAANRDTGGATRYVPNITGDLDAAREQMRIARAEGIDTVLIAPMILGFAAVHRLARDFPDMAIIAHPAMAGAARIAPPLLLGKLFRLIGADAAIFPNEGGRFGYSRETCRAIAQAARGDWHGLKPCLPVPAGGMTLARVPELLDFYGEDTMLLIGGSLLGARDRLTEATRAFTHQVASHRMQHV